MEEVKMKTGKPLQIIDFKTIDGNKKELVLNRDNLESILKPVEDLPIAFVSITGASRQGKSFLLSFMIRYLEALKIDETDWMGWDNVKASLIGFKWRDGINPETSGMWLWSEPFIVESDGEKFAILLMDTQGTFDEYTTEREWSTIVGLSMLISSCTIFNCFANVQEDVLNTLDSYMQYGMQAMQQSGMEEQRPFQKLMFLIRDWRMVSQFPYGSKGGSQFLEEKLKIKPDQPEQAQRVRKSIKNCFEMIECFLMPDPGEKAKEKDFSGAISQLTNNFAKKIEQFVTEFLNPDEIPKKTVFGVEFKGQDFLNYFDKYVEIFNGDELPEPVSIFHATAQLRIQSLVQKAKKVYLEHMKKKQRGHNFFTDKNMSSFHKESEKKALDAFKKEKKIGSDEMVTQFEEVLQEDITKEFKNLQALNKNKREREIAKAEEDGINSYKSQMEDEFSDDFFDDKKLAGMSETFITKVVEEFQEKIEEEEHELEKLASALKKKLQEEQGNFQTSNKLKRAEAEAFMTQVVENIIVEHLEELNSKFENDETLEMDGLQEIHKDTLKKSLDNFKTADKKGDKSFIGTYKKNLEESLENRKEEVITTYLKAQEQKKLKAEKLISDLVEQFKQKLSLDVDNAENEDELLEKQEEYSKEAIENYEDNHGYSSANVVMIELGQNLKEKLTTTFEKDILGKYQMKLKENEASFEKAYAEALKLYTEEMNSFIRTKEYHDENDLKAHNEKSIKAALKHYNISPKLGKNIEEKDEEMLEKMEEEIESLFEKTLEQNELKKSNLEQKSLNDVTECLKEYQAQMKTQLEKARNEEKLKEFHLDALNKAKTSFRDKCPIKTDEEFLETYIESIEQQVEESFEEILELYQLKAEEQAVGTEKALMDARKYYHEEMKKHYSNTVFMRPKDLEELHLRVSKKSIDRCSAAAPLTELQIEDLEASLTVTYKQYEESNNMNVPTDPAIGIDLGTTYSCVAVYYKGNVKIIPNKEGKNTTPSYVAFKGGVEIIGEAAKNQAHENPENTIFDAKRIIGRRMDDTKLQEDIKLWPFKVVEENGVAKIEAEGRTYFPEQISAKVLQEMRSIAESFLGGITISKAVITVPAYFTNGQREATIDAARIAGLDPVKIIDEPTAAAIAYKLQHMDNENRNVFIYDLGGGTFDVAVLEMRKGEIEVKAKDGDTHLGGEDFDNNLMEHCALEFQADVGVDILDGKDSPNAVTKRKCQKAMRRVRNESERRKIDMAAAKKVNVVVDSLEDGHDMNIEVSRDEFETMNKELFEKTIEIVERVLHSAGKTKNQIDDIVLVGGSTRIPKIQQLLTDFFNGKALNKTINPDEAVAVGAAVHAAIWNGEIAKGSKDFNNILDTAPHSMGIEVLGGGHSVIIHKDDRIPCKKEESYTTARDMQESVRIAIFQGEKKIAIENTPLGEFTLGGIPPAKKGTEEIKVNMDYNDQGILIVTAICTSNGKSCDLKIDKWRITEEAIQKILAEGNST